MVKIGIHILLQGDRHIHNQI